LQAWVDDVNRHAEGFGNDLDGHETDADEFTLLNAAYVLAADACTMCTVSVRYSGTATYFVVVHDPNKAQISKATMIAPTMLTAWKHPAFILSSSLNPL
jgi:hypothetical protein